MKRTRLSILPFLVAALALPALVVGACKKTPEPGAGPAPSSTPVGSAASAAPAVPVVVPAPTSSSPSGIVQFIPAPPGPVIPIIRAVQKQAKDQDRRVVVFNSSAKSEPCVRFHESGAHGDLDGSLAKVTILEFDLDRDAERLAAAGYSSKVVPSFTIPMLDGKASRFVFEGSPHSPALVAFLAMKVQGLIIASRSGLDH